MTLSCSKISNSQRVEAQRQISLKIKSLSIIVYDGKREFSLSALMQVAADFIDLKLREQCCWSETLVSLTPSIFCTHKELKQAV